MVFRLPYSKNWKREFGRTFLEQADAAGIADRRFDPKLVQLTDVEKKEVAFADDISKGQFPLSVRYALPTNGKAQDEAEGVPAATGDRRKSKLFSRVASEPTVCSVELEEVTQDQVRQLLAETVRLRGQMKQDLKGLTREMVERLQSSGDSERHAALEAIQAAKQQLLDVHEPENKHEIKRLGASEQEAKQALETMRLQLMGELFLDMYQKVRVIIPADPLAQFGLSPSMFESLLQKYNTEPFVTENLPKALGALSPRNVPQARVERITIGKVIEIHALMLEVLKDILLYYGRLENWADFDVNATITTAQAIVSARVEQLHQVTCEELEGAVFLHQSKLVEEPDFLDVNIEVQNTMRKFLDMAQLGPR